MKIAILNGNPNRDNAAFDGYLKRLSEELVSDGQAVTVFTLRDMDIQTCIRRTDYRTCLSGRSWVKSALCLRGCGL